MSWLATIAIAIVLLAVVLYALLAIAIIVTALVERRPVKPLAPAEPDDPEWQCLGAAAVGHGTPDSPASDRNPYSAPRVFSYAEPLIRAACRLGFTTPGLYKHVKGGVYKTRCVLMVSPSQQILAVFRWGTTASIRHEGTLLYSALEDGRYLLTTDRLVGYRVPEIVDDLVYLGADFDQLVRRHEGRLSVSSHYFRRLSPEKLLAEYHTILERRARFLVAKGDAYWLDPEESEFRSTLKGALKAYAQTLSTSHVDRSLSMTAR